jgi:hypothetical protein
MYKDEVASSDHSRFNENLFMLNTGIRGLEKYCCLSVRWKLILQAGNQKFSKIIYISRFHFTIFDSFKKLVLI